MTKSLKTEISEEWIGQSVVKVVLDCEYILGFSRIVKFVELFKNTQGCETRENCPSKMRQDVGTTDVFCSDRRVLISSSVSMAFLPP